jgi:hypothetical protein
VCLVVRLQASVGAGYQAHLMQPAQDGAMVMWREALTDQLGEALAVHVIVLGGACNLGAMAYKEVATQELAARMPLWVAISGALLRVLVDRLPFRTVHDGRYRAWLVASVLLFSGFFVAFDLPDNPQVAGQLLAPAGRRSAVLQLVESPATDSLTVLRWRLGAAVAAGPLLGLMLAELLAMLVDHTSINQQRRPREQQRAATDGGGGGGGGGGVGVGERGRCRRGSERVALLMWLLIASLTAVIVLGSAVLTGNNYGVALSACGLVSVAPLSTGRATRQFSDAALNLLMLRGNSAIAVPSTVALQASLMRLRGRVLGALGLSWCTQSLALVVLWQVAAAHVKLVGSDTFWACRWGCDQHSAIFGCMIGIGLPLLWLSTWSCSRRGVLAQTCLRRELVMLSTLLITLSPACVAWLLRPSLVLAALGAAIAFAAIAALVVLCCLRERLAWDGAAAPTALAWGGSGAPTVNRASWLPADVNSEALVGAKPARSARLHAELLELLLGPSHVCQGVWVLLSSSHSPLGPPRAAAGVSVGQTPPRRQMPSHTPPRRARRKPMASQDRGEGERSGLLEPQMNTSRRSSVEPTQGGVALAPLDPLPDPPLPENSPMTSELDDSLEPDGLLLGPAGLVDEEVLEHTQLSLSARTKGGSAVRVPATSAGADSLWRFVALVQALDVHDSEVEMRNLLLELEMSSPLESTRLQRSEPQLSVVSAIPILENAALRQSWSVSDGTRLQCIAQADATASQAAGGFPRSSGGSTIACAQATFTLSVTADAQSLLQTVQLAATGSGDAASAQRKALLYRHLRSALLQAQQHVTTGNLDAAEAAEREVNAVLAQLDAGSDATGPSSARLGSSSQDAVPQERQMMAKGGRVEDAYTAKQPVLVRLSDELALSVKHGATVANARPHSAWAQEERRWVWQGRVPSLLLGSLGLVAVCALEQWLHEPL